MTLSIKAYEKIIIRTNVWHENNQSQTFTWSVYNALVDVYYFFPLAEREKNFSRVLFEALHVVYFTKENYKSILSVALTEKQSKVIKVI